MTDTSHGERYPGPHGPDTGERQPHEPQPAGGDDIARGNAVEQPGTPSTGGGREPTDTDAAPPAGASPGAGVSGNEVDPSRPGPAPQTDDFAELGAIDTAAIVANQAPADMPPAGYDPRTAPSDRLHSAPVPPSALPGTGPGAAVPAAPGEPRAEERDTRDVAEISRQAPGPQEGGRTSS